MKKIFIIVALAFASMGNVYGVSITATFSKNAIDENKYFIDYINPHLTNFYTEDYFKRYKEAVILDFEANTYYLSGEYTKCFLKITESQKILKKIYYDLLINRYEPDTAQILKMSGPIILLSKDKKAEYYLITGYTERSKSLDQKKMGYGINPNLLSMKIKYYINAINHIIRSKRYAILALIESTIPIIDKTDYKHQTFAEALKAEHKNEPGDIQDISDYEFIRNELINNMNKKGLPSDFPFLLHHNDNYQVIHENKKSVLNEIGDSINSSVKGLQNSQKDIDKTSKNGETDKKNTAEDNNVVPEK